MDDDILIGFLINTLAGASLVVLGVWLESQAEARRTRIQRLSSLKQKVSRSLAHWQGRRLLVLDDGTKDGVLDNEDLRLFTDLTFGLQELSALANESHDVELQEYVSSISRFVRLLNQCQSANEFARSLSEGLPTGLETGRGKGGVQ
jgi:hypothetical protein